jgi:predicted ABC-type ATPase
VGSLLVVTGPPGAGKSTLAALLAARLEHSVLVDGDSFFGFLRVGAIAPWRPEAHGQNTVVTRAAGAASGQYARGGLNTVYDGMIGPWFVDEFLAATGLETLDYAILLPPVDICVGRVLTRQNHNFADEGATRHMHRAFIRNLISTRHVIQCTNVPVEGLAERIIAARSRGQLTYPVS